MEAGGVVVRYTFQDSPDPLAKGVNVLSKLVARKLEHKAIEVEAGSDDEQLGEGWEGPGW